MGCGAAVVAAGPWRAFGDELARWRDLGRTVEFWWRDDDAARAEPALERLAALALDSQVPLALAVVPEAAEPALIERLGRGIAVLQHGADHRNRARDGEKKTEFPGHEPADAALGRLSAAREHLLRLAGERSLPVLAPPWNRLPRELVARLPAAGFRGLSGFGARAAAEPVPGLRQVNAHVDIIAWRGSRGFAGEEEALAQAVRHLAARRDGAADAAEPTGWLTHHARHDEAAWRFLARLFEATRDVPGVRWLRAAELFA
jgi:hypothetical protein